MANRNIRALEHQGEIYLHLGDLESYIVSLSDKVASPMTKDALHALIYKLREVRGARPDAAVR